MAMFGLQCHCVSKVVEVFKACGVGHYCLVLSSVANKRTLSTIKFMKYKLYNCLTICLDLVVKMYAWKFYKLKIFPFYTPIQK